MKKLIVAAAILFAATGLKAQEVSPKQAIKINPLS